MIGALILLGLYAGTVISPQQLQNALQGLGPLAVAGYIALFTVLPAFFFPVAVLALAGGLLFGLLWGSVYTFLGAMLNCTVMFLIARGIGRNRIRNLVAKKLSPVWQQRLSHMGGSRGALLLVVLRLIPAVPYNLINYAFGLTDMKLSTYLLTSAVGIVPGTLAFINIGDKALDVSSPDFWIAIAGLLLLLVVTGILGKLCFPNHKKGDDTI